MRAEMAGEQTINRQTSAVQTLELVNEIGEMEGAVKERQSMDKNERWLQWAVRLQSIAQAGLYYGKDPFDQERYEQVRAIAADDIVNNLLPPFVAEVNVEVWHTDAFRI